MLACPLCSGSLSLQALDDVVESGSLCCERCHKEYPIEQGILHFIRTEELTGYNRRFARLYDRFSWVYGAFSKAAFAFIGMTEEQGRREVLDRLQPNGGRVLEVSVGPGVNLPYLVGALGVGNVYGLDISIGQLRRCNSLIRRKGWPVDLFLGNAESLPFQGNTFDAVFHVGGINFFGDKRKAIAEMIRVAQPGTRILIADETERGARGYERTLPGFKQSFKDKRPPVVPPIELIPASMQEVRLFDIWKGWMYCIEFLKP
jgi:ubiquinone/menaquinone biosynthesis C-methylase UbiE